MSKNMHPRERGLSVPRLTKNISTGSQHETNNNNGASHALRSMGSNESLSKRFVGGTGQITDLDEIVSIQDSSIQDGEEGHHHLEGGFQDYINLKDMNTRI